MMLKAFVRLFPFLILQKEFVLSLPGCDTDRPGWATHRTLRIPASMVTESSSEKAWTNALCCVYTYVEVSNSLSTPRLVAYDGSSFSINKDSAVDSMIEAYDEVCDMSMGKKDCQNKGSCVDDALEELDDSADDRCVDDADFRFRNKAKKNCAWVGKFKRWKRCRKRWHGALLSEFCPQTCRVCN